jgi:putative transcriptional regulator
VEGAEAMTKFGDDLIAALGQALAHARGDDSGVGAVHEIDRAREAVDVKAVRRRAGLKQAEMARIMDMSLSGYRKWEQHTRAVSGPARTMLVMMEREPQAVFRALAPEMKARGKRPSSSKRKAGKPATLSREIKGRKPGGHRGS